MIGHFHTVVRRGLDSGARVRDDPGHGSAMDFEQAGSS